MFDFKWLTHGKIKKIILKKKTKYFDLEIEEQEKWIRIYMRGPKL